MISSIKNIFSNIFNKKQEAINLDLKDKFIKADISPKLIEEIFTQKKLSKKEDIKDYLSSLNKSANIPNKGVMIFVGINGSGKTTAVGKLAYFLKQNGHKPLLIAADTFRAAAIEQLEKWGEKNNIDIFTSDQKDPSAVVYKGCEKFKNSDNDILLIDTAGRLQENINLMKELDKIKRSVSKVLPDEDIFTILTVDALLGQNSIDQAKIFHEKVGLDGIILTKMDGPAKGGTALTIMHKFGIPTVAISFGENTESILPFNFDEYLNALFE